MKPSYWINSLGQFFILVVTLSLGLSRTVCAQNLPSAGRAHEQLQGHYLRLQQDYQELESYLDVLILALLSEQHTLALGAPGGSKSKLATDLLQSLRGEHFSLQFSPSTKQDQILGTVKGKKYLESGELEWLVDQSLLAHE